jgi:hypothetical protein
MRSGADLNATVNYTLKTDTDNPTVWKLGIIPSSLYNRILTELTGTDQIYALAQVGLKGWENYNIPYSREKQEVAGEEIEAVPMSILDRIDQNDVAELAIQIISVNKLTEAERGN